MYRNPKNVSDQYIIELIQTEDRHTVEKEGWKLLNWKFQKKLIKVLKKEFPAKLNKSLIDKTIDITLKDAYRIISNGKFPKNEKLKDYINRRGREFMFYYLIIQPTTKESK